jgi:hypothetical protein
MSKYYLNGGDAFRLKLWIERPEEEVVDESEGVQLEEAVSTK